MVFGSKILPLGFEGLKPVALVSKSLISKPDPLNCVNSIRFMDGYADKSSIIWGEQTLAILSVFLILNV